MTAPSKSRQASTSPVSCAEPNNPSRTEPESSFLGDADASYLLDRHRESDRSHEMRWRRDARRGARPLPRFDSRPRLPDALVLLDLRHETSLPESQEMRIVAYEISRVRERVAFGTCAVVACRDALFGMLRMFGRYRRLKLGWQNGAKPLVLGRKRSMWRKKVRTSGGLT
jgi:hypothetical protein